MKKQTKAIFSPYRLKDPYGALAFPVYNAVAYEFDNAKTMADAFTNRIDRPDYSRIKNPTVSNYEDRVKALTGARDVVALNSGMAAISNTLITLTAKGKNIVTSRHLFGNTFAFIASTLRRFGVEARLVDMTDVKAVSDAIDDDTCCVFLEIITNPQMEVADLAALAEAAHSKHVPVVADTTIIPFTQFSSASLGVDIEIVSSTKYISAGATSLGGLIIDYGTFRGFGQLLRGDAVVNLGALMNPQVAFMQTMGLETLDARYERQAANAQRLAEKLTTLPQIKRVSYVGLKDNEYYELARKQFGPTSGCMICIDMESKEACFSLIDKLQLVHRATNLFDNRTLAIHPASTIFGLFSPKQRKNMDVLDTTIRLSVGLEDVDDIFDDIKQAAE